MTKSVGEHFSKLANAYRAQADDPTEHPVVRARARTIAEEHERQARNTDRHAKKRT